jgi:hypothetical protein
MVLKDRFYHEAISLINSGIKVLPKIVGNTCMTCSIPIFFAQVLFD